MNEEEIDEELAKMKKQKHKEHFMRFQQLQKRMAALQLLNRIRLNTIDKGGEPIYDANGNIVGKTDPLQELVSSGNQRCLISISIKHAMKEYFLSIDDLKLIWAGFLRMDYKHRGWVNFNHLLTYL